MVSQSQDGHNVLHLLVQDTSLVAFGWLGIEGTRGPIVEVEGRGVRSADEHPEMDVHADRGVAVAVHVVPRKARRAGIIRYSIYSAKKIFFETRLNAQNIFRH